MNLEIEPLKSVGPIRLGETREIVRRALGRRRLSSFEKAPGEPVTDSYDGLGCHIYYDKNDRAEAVEIFAPAAPTLFRIRLLGRDVTVVDQELASLGHKSKQTGVGSRYQQIGIALTASAGVVEGVLVVCPGYWR